MINIAIFGFGTVGGGVAELLSKNAGVLKKTVGDDIGVKYILDLRDFPGSPWADRVVHDIGAILADPEVSVVVEAMGGSHPAYEFSVRAMEAGKSVVTSNKEVAANYGVSLLEAAEKNGVYYLFEAAVGGGIPVIRNVRSSQATDKITRITGILNGTTNYILTEMEKNGKSYEAALAEAKSFGYAEADPSADLDGIDTQRKLCILAALATGKLAKCGDIRAESMRNVTSEDIVAAKRLDGAVKLTGCADMSGDGAALAVFPAIVPFTNPLAHIKDVYNGILVASELTGDVMYYGRGAGRYPTAGAIISDVVSVVTGAESKLTRERWTEAPAGYVKPYIEAAYRRYIRLAEDKAPELPAGCERLEGAPRGTVEYVTPKLTEPEFCAVIAKLPDGAVLSSLRVL